MWCRRRRRRRRSFIQASPRPRAHSPPARGGGGVGAGVTQSGQRRPPSLLPSPSCCCCTAPHRLPLALLCALNNLPPTQPSHHGAHSIIFRLSACPSSTSGRHCAHSTIFRPVRTQSFSGRPTGRLFFVNQRPSRHNLPAAGAGSRHVSVSTVCACFVYLRPGII